MKTKVLYQSELWHVDANNDGVVIFFCGEPQHIRPTARDLAYLEHLHQNAKSAEEDAALYAAYTWLKAHLNTQPSVHNISPTAWSIVTQRGDGPHFVARDKDGKYILDGVHYDTLSAAVASVMGVSNDFS